MQRTDTSDPNYYHKVVDCQWACPAHTNVPEYIRMIAQGRFDDAYILNRESNVFPGILGRTCDRPCEPACRRTRVDGKPVAICRLKRVAADNKDDIRHRIPKAPTQKNGKKVALIGAGPASLTVANDLMPLGYQCTVFEKGPRPGGLMRINIPAFRLPEQILDEEIGYIVDMGVEMKYDTPVASLKSLVETGGYDAVFVGSGAPKGKELDLPGRHDTDQIFIGIEWLESIHFGHVDSIGKRVLIIGVGNTAMDCCRSAKRLGATDVKVISRKTRKYFKASPWELEDAEEEQVEILENLSPVRFIVENGKLTGMEFDKFTSQEIDGKLVQEPAGRIVLDCDSVVLAIGQENAFPWIERDMGLEFDKWNMPKVDKATFMATRPGVFFGGDAAFGPANIIWAVEHGHQAAISIHQVLPGPVRHRTSAARHDAHQHQDGPPRVVVQQQLRPGDAAEDEARVAADPVFEDDGGGGRGLHRGADAQRGGALPQLRRGDALHRFVVHRVRCLHRHLPNRLPDDCSAGRIRVGAAANDARAGYQPRSAAIPLEPSQADRAVDGEGRERVPALRPLRRALSDLRVGHAEVRGRAPSGWNGVYSVGSGGEIDVWRARASALAKPATAEAVALRTRI